MYYEDLDSIYSLTTAYASFPGLVAKGYGNIEVVNNAKKIRFIKKVKIFMASSIPINVFQVGNSNTAGIYSGAEHYIDNIRYYDYLFQGTISKPGYLDTWSQVSNWSGGIEMIYGIGDSLALMAGTSITNGAGKIRTRVFYTVIDLEG